MLKWYLYFKSLYFDIISTFNDLNKYLTKDVSMTE